MVKKGSNDTFGEIDLESLGTLVIKDDGSHDRDIQIELKLGPNSNGMLLIGPPSELGVKRCEVEDLIERVNNPNVNAPGSDSNGPFPDGPFCCDSCGKTWPSSKKVCSGGKELCQKCEGQQ